jgi:hypothetical protein
MKSQIERVPHLFIGDIDIPDDWTIHEIMYQVPGYGAPNFEVYKRAREKNKKELERLTLKQRVASIIDEHTCFDILKDALSSDDSEMQKTAGELVAVMSNQESRSTLQQIIEARASELLASEQPELQLEGVRMLRYIPADLLESQIAIAAERITALLQHAGIEYQKIGAQMITYYPDKEEQFAFRKEVVKLCQRYLDSSAIEEKRKIIELLQYISENDLAKILERVFSDSDYQPLQTDVATFLKRLSTHNSPPILLKVLHSNDAVIRREAVIATGRIFVSNASVDVQIPDRLGQKVDSTVQGLLHTHNSDSPEYKRNIKLLEFIQNSNILFAEIRRLLESEDKKDIIAGIKSIKYMTKYPELRKRMVDLLLMLLDSDDTDVFSATIPELRHVPDPEKRQCMTRAVQIVDSLLQSDDLSVKKVGASLVYYIDHAESERLFKKIEENDVLVHALCFSRLYPEQSSQAEITNHSVHRKVNIEKTGSRMTVLRDGPLEKKILIRHIKKSAFVGWKTAFEASDMWLEEGFDYVPVEPVQSFTFQKDHVDVFAAVFDIDLKHWLSVSGGRYRDSLVGQRKKIIDVLKKLNIRHGDLHEGNFFLQFSRREDGTIDTLSEPKLYVGDFDKSKLNVQP